MNIRGAFKAALWVLGGLSGLVTLWCGFFYFKGMHDAHARIGAGRPGILKYGYPSMDYPQVDRASGLPHINAGCIVSFEGDMYEWGFNTTIRAALAAGTIPTPKLRAKMMTQTEVIAVLKENTPSVLSVDAPSLEIAAGAERVTLEVDRADPEGGAWGYLMLQRGPSPENRYVLLDRIQKVRVVTLDDGTTALVHDPQRRACFVFDLPGGLMIARYDSRRR